MWREFVRDGLDNEHFSEEGGQVFTGKSEKGS